MRQEFNPEPTKSQAPTPLAAALAYAEQCGWPVFPLGWEGDRRRLPLLKRPGERGTGGHYQASADPRQIEAWWKRWPQALIGTPTGRRSGLVVLDIDTKPPKNPGDRWNWGFDTLAELGAAILPETPMVHTPSCGLHVHFSCNDRVEIRNSQGKHGLGPGLDVRGEGGYAPLPTPGSDYRWDPHYHLGAVPLAAAPAWLGYHAKRAPDRDGRSRRFDPETALGEACDAIRNAGAGDRHDTLNREVYSIAALVAAGLLPEAVAYRQLRDAALVMVGRTRGDRHKAQRDFEDAWADGRHAPRRARA